MKVRTTVHAIEQGIIDWLATQGVEANRRCGYPGVWMGGDKIAAVGMHFRKGVSMHGFALNLTTDLKGFALITPCGIRDGGVTALCRWVEHAPTPAEAAPNLGLTVLRILGTMGR